MRKLVALATPLLVLSGSLGAALLFAGSAPSFARATSYPTGRHPYSLAMGDLNGDGKLDLATANLLSDTVSVLLNRDGRFQAKVDYRTGSGPSSVAIGDLNGDGKPDLATGNDGAVSVLANRGDGTFARHVELEARGAGVAIGDLNGDGRPDLATAGAYAVSVLLNRGGGSFEAEVDYRTGSGPASVAIGDLNGDGRPDLVTANGGDDTISVLFNASDGRFQAKHDYGVGIYPDSVALGDLNGDGKPDLVAANGDESTVSVLLNRGEGRFSEGRYYRTGHWPEEVAIGDLNGDGKPDLATANLTTRDFRSQIAGTVSVLPNRGDGTFHRRIDYGSGRGTSSVAIGDLNSDLKPDLATSNSRASTVSVLINTPGLCTVQDVKGRRLPVAREMIARANCRVEKIRRAESKTVKRGRVISEQPKPGTVLPNRGMVNLVVSRGRRAS
jgi:hypothetical protein